MSKKRIIWTSKEAIVEYWAKRVPETDMGTDWDIALDRCWRCGRESKRLCRCHIVPDMLGGADTPSNYVLLCGACHEEAPSCTDPSVMWLWIKRTSRRLGGIVLLLERAIHEFEEIYGTHDPQAKAWHRIREVLQRHMPKPLADFQIDAFTRALRESESKTGYHPSTRPTAPATIAWVLRQAFDAAHAAVRPDPNQEQSAGNTSGLVQGLFSFFNSVESSEVDESDSDELGEE